MGAVLLPDVALHALGEHSNGVRHALQCGLVVYLTVTPKPADGGISSSSSSAIAASSRHDVMAQEEQKDRHAFAKCLEHGAGVFRTGSAVLSPHVLLMEAMSIAVGQYYMHEINDKLHTLEVAAARVEGQRGASLFGVLHSCEMRLKELEEELTLEELPEDWELRLVHVHAEATTGLCRAEVAFAGFVARMTRITQAVDAETRLEAAAALSDVAAAETDFTLLVAHTRLSLRLRQLVYARDVRVSDHRVTLSQQRLLSALQAAQQQLVTFACLESAVRALEDALAQQTWLARHIAHRSTAAKVRQVIRSINELQQRSGGPSCASIS